jgi:hypothetical protein
MRHIFFFFMTLFIASAAGAIDCQKLEGDLRAATAKRFNYDLSIQVLKGSHDHADIMICCHGMGANYHTAATIRANPDIESHLIGFNLPDHSLSIDAFNVSKTTYGTIQELLPLIAIIRECTVHQAVDKISLYGFSSGGGTVVNTIAVLNTSRYDADLRKLGVSGEDKVRMLDAIQKGVILLEVPLKSMEEIIAVNGCHPAMQFLMNRYRKNDMTPISSLKYLQGSLMPRLATATMSFLSIALSFLILQEIPLGSLGKPAAI